VVLSRTRGVFAIILSQKQKIEQIRRGEERSTCARTRRILKKKKTVASRKETTSTGKTAGTYTETHNDSKNELKKRE